MSEPGWIAVELRRPQDGQLCLVRERHSFTWMNARFRATPVPRWEVGSDIYQYQFFVEWAPDGGGHG
jgi:hypothetical protein